jgi:hypothetical protein
MKLDDVASAVQCSVPSYQPDAWFVVILAALENRSVILCACSFTSVVETNVSELAAYWISKRSIASYATIL